MTKKVISLDYHRNGIMGLGFYVAIVEDMIDGKLHRMAVVRFGATDQEGFFSGRQLDNEAGNVVCAVLDIDKLASGDIAFGSNSWRGDHSHEIIDEAIKQRQVDMMQPLAGAA